MQELTLAQARNLHLSAQGLLNPASDRATAAALRNCITRMRLLQIDTIHIVARSPYLVLFSRISDYPMQWLDKALERAQALYLEAGVVLDEPMALELAAAIQRCADWHGTPSVKIVHTSPHKAAAPIRRALRAHQKEA